MKDKLNRLIAGLVVSCVSPIAVYCHASQVNAQQIAIPEVEIIGQNAIQGLRTCNQIMNLANANPGNIQLRMQARGCSLRLYKYQMCLVRESSAFPPNPNLAAKCANENLGG